MYISGYSLLGKETINIDQDKKEIYREILYNRPEYQLIYTENYNLGKGLDINITITSIKESAELYKNHMEEDDIKEIDIDNLFDFCINVINTKSLPSSMLAEQNKEIELTLTDNKGNSREFTLIPETDGSIFHFKDTVLYTKCIPNASNPDQDALELPIFYTENIITKIIFSDNILITKDYNDNCIFGISIDNKGKLIFNLKYKSIPELSIGNYKLNRNIVISNDTYTNSYSEDINFLINGSTEKAFIDYKETEHNEHIREYSSFYPIHYTTILGNICMDDDNHIICANEKVITDNGNIVEHTIEYHRITKVSYESLLNGG